MRPKGDKKRTNQLLILAYIVVISASLLALLIALPSISQSIQRSGLLQLIEQERQSKESDETSVRSERHRQIIFFIPHKTTTSFQAYSVPIAGKLPYHETVEALLNGPPLAALEAGALSAIPTGTRLIGLTVSEQVAFVDLSQELLEDTPWGTEVALEQIRRTLAGFSTIRATVILVEGEMVEL